MATYTGVSWTTVTVYFDSSYPGVLAPIFEDVGMTVPKDNPFVNWGNYTFYAAAGLYKIVGDFTRLIDGSGSGSGSGDSFTHLHGLQRILGDGATTTFNLLDIAEYLEHTSVNGSIQDPNNVTLSADRGQITFSAAPGSGEVIALEYVIANI